VKIVIVSSIPLLREGLASSLASVEPDAEVMTEPSVSALYLRPSAQHLDVVVVDVMHDIDLEEIGMVAEKFPGVVMLALGLPERNEEFVRRGRAGFYGYVARDTSLRELQTSVMHAVAGRQSGSPKITDGRIRALFRRRRRIAVKPSSPNGVDWTPAIR
jgi:DNA-binding NarL/FixJ family response regulator